MAELIAKTSAAIAVDEDLTTLIDWVNIEGVSGFTVIIENSGGGSAKDLTDITIDTSDDGGTTADLDQHAGTPAVPVVAGASSLGAFDETAPYVRIRAKCAADEDTTASAVLLADTATGRLCTLADVKDRLGIEKTEFDDILNMIITSLESIFNNYTHRHLIVTPAAVTEFYTGSGDDYLQLKRYPLVAITSIKESLAYNFDDATALTADTNYRLINNGFKGIIHKRYSRWPAAPDCIQIIYRGGYCSAGQSPADDEYSLPADIRDAAIMQASLLFKRRDDINISSQGFQGGSTKNEPLKLLPFVRDILKDYRRHQL